MITTITFKGYIDTEDPKMVKLEMVVYNRVPRIINISVSSVGSKQERFSRISSILRHEIFCPIMVSGYGFSNFFKWEYKRTNHQECNLRLSDFS